MKLEKKNFEAKQKVRKIVADEELKERVKLGRGSKKLDEFF